MIDTIIPRVGLGLAQARHNYAQQANHALMRLHGWLACNGVGGARDETAVPLGYASKTAKCKVISTSVSYRNHDIVRVWSACV